MQVLAVPVKALERAKSRLSKVLTVPERAALALAMFEDVLDAAAPTEGWQTWVVSGDEAVLEIAARRGARPFPERAPSLLDALHEVEAKVPGRGSALAVLPADLPLLSRRSLATALAVDAAVVVAPATSQQDVSAGTNLLVRRPATVIPARFGPASAARHRFAAHRAHVSYQQIDDPQLGFDVDRVEDLEALVAMHGDKRTFQICHELHLAARLLGEPWGGYRLAP
jgi:2-phospho-L-lactate guanylyltransferase